MKVSVVKNYDEMSKLAADIIASQIVIKPNAVLGLATGSTPVGTYQKLIEKYEKGELDFSKVSSVNLDEYVGLSPENEQSYRYFMNDNLFNHINIDKDNTHVLSGLEPDAEKECKSYDDLIDCYENIDIQVLGIGRNGHIGFNEPSTAFKAGTHCVELTEETIADNTRFFDSVEEVPTKAYTMGMKGIMKAKKIILLANGENKADAIKKAIYGPITPEVPASILQLHNDVVVIVDEDAGKYL